MVPRLQNLRYFRTRSISLETLVTKSVAQIQLVFFSEDAQSRLPSASQSETIASSSPPATNLPAYRSSAPAGAVSCP